MFKKISIVLLTSISFFAFATKVTYTCSNSCVTTVDMRTGVVTVADCCGGTVTATIERGEPGAP